MSKALKTAPAHLRECQPRSATWRIEPFLHLEAGRIYNPLTDRALEADEPCYEELRAMVSRPATLDELPDSQATQLIEQRWIVKDSSRLASRFRLKYVSLEASTVCNQSCYFCPVSIDRREDHFMPMDLYQRICAQLAEHRSTLEGVSMINYNEPTVDKRFVAQVHMLLEYGLPPAVLTNGTGMTPRRVDAILAMGGLKYLSINISTLDRERYRQDRGGDHLGIVTRNLQHMQNLRIAQTMEIVVLGTGDDTHRKDFEEIAQRFGDSNFDVKYYEVMDRAGIVPVGMKPPFRHKRLCGCEQTGSRPLQWVHITPRGECVLCCQDYHDRYVVGDLNHQSLNDILTGPEMEKMRRWVYGMEEAPEDFICRGCVYALTE